MPARCGPKLLTVIRLVALLSDASAKMRWSPVEMAVPVGRLFARRDRSASPLSTPPARPLLLAVLTAVMSPVPVPPPPLCASHVILPAPSAVGTSPKLAALPLAIWFGLRNVIVLGARARLIAAPASTSGPFAISIRPKVACVAIGMVVDSVKVAPPPVCSMVSSHTRTSGA